MAWDVDPKKLYPEGPRPKAVKAIWASELLDDHVRSCTRFESFEQMVQEAGDVQPMGPEFDAFVAENTAFASFMELARPAITDFAIRAFNLDPSKIPEEQRSVPKPHLHLFDPDSE